MMQQHTHASTTSEQRQGTVVDLIRWGGIAAMLGGVAFAAEGTLYLLTAPDRIQDALLLAGYVLVAAGLAGFHALQRKKDGRLGRAGLYVGIVGSLAGAIAVSGSLVSSADFELLHGVGFLLMIVGYLLFGAATLRAKALPRAYGITFLLIGPVSMAPVEYSVIFFGLIWLALGYALWRRADTSPARKQPAN
jgi:hypothetical protein